MKKDPGNLTQMSFQGHDDAIPASGAKEKPQ
jgi:hypothetical protein